MRSDRDSHSSTLRARALVAVAAIGGTLVVTAGPASAAIPGATSTTLVQVRKASTVRDWTGTSYALTIRITIETTRTAAIVHVADDGPGLPKTVRARLFRRGRSVALEAGGHRLGVVATGALASISDLKLSGIPTDAFPLPASPV